MYQWLTTCFVVLLMILFFKTFFNLKQEATRMNRRTLETADSWWRMRHNHVWIDERKLREDSYLAVGRGEEFSLPAWDFAGIYPQSNDAFSRFIFWFLVRNKTYTGNL